MSKSFYRYMVMKMILISLVSAFACWVTKTAWGVWGLAFLTTIERNKGGDKNE